MQLLGRRTFTWDLASKGSNLLPEWSVFGYETVPFVVVWPHRTNMPMCTAESNVESQPLLRHKHA